MPKETFDHLQKFLFFGLLLSVTVLFLWVLWPFLMGIFWAVVFAILLYPIFVALRKKLKNPSLASILAICATLIVICIPLYLVGSLAASEALDLYGRASTNSLNVSQLAEIPVVAEALTAIGVSPQEASEALSGAVRDASEYLATHALSASIATLSTLLQLGVMLYLLFFFLRDGEALLRYMMRLIPLGDAREKLLFARFASTTRAVFKGTLIVSLAQGAVGALLFLIAGIPSPILWGSVMALAATIPAVGPFIIWLPAGLILLAQGAIWQGVFVLLGGAFIIGSLDNVLRPILVGRDIEMPDALVLLSILGGIATFGVAGIIIGPVIGALFLSIWDLFGKDFGDELASRG